MEEKKRNSWTRSELEMVIDRWRHAPEREEKRKEILEARRITKHLREAPSVWVFGVNNEGQLGQVTSSSALRNPLEVKTREIVIPNLKGGVENEGLTKMVPVMEYVEGCLFPRRLEELHNRGVLEVHSGFSCSMAGAITEDGDLYLWGNGEDVHSMLHGGGGTNMSPPGTARSTGSVGSGGSGGEHPLLKVKFKSDADRFAYQMDRDAIRDIALKKFSITVGEYREHQIVKNHLIDLRQKYFDWLNQTVPEGTAVDTNVNGDDVHFVIEKPTLYDFEPFLRLMGKWGCDIWKNEYAGEWVEEETKKNKNKNSEDTQKSKLNNTTPSTPASTNGNSNSGSVVAGTELKSPTNVKRTIILSVSDTGKLPPYPPTIVDVLRGEEITSVSMCKSPRSIHCVCVTVDGGDTFVGGDNSLGQLGISPQIVTRTNLNVCPTIPSMAHVSCGGGHGVGISDKGHVYAWGCSMDGRLGVGLYRKVGVEDILEQTTFAPSPVSPKPTSDQIDQYETSVEEMESSRNPIVYKKAKEYVDLFELQSPMSGLQVHSISCGLMHTVCSAGATRTVFSWGSGVGYRLGHGDCITTAWPRRIDSLWKEKQGAETVLCCNTYSGLLTPTGLVYSWGRGAKGQLGLGGNSEDMTAVYPRQILFQRQKRMKVGLGALNNTKTYVR